MAMAARKQKDNDKSNPSSHTSFITLYTPEKIKRLHQLQQNRKRVKLYIDRLKQKISSVADRDGVLVNEEMYEDLKTMASEYTKQVKESTQEDSFKRLFWDQQQKLHH